MSYTKHQMAVDITQAYEAYVMACLRSAQLWSVSTLGIFATGAAPSADGKVSIAWHSRNWHESEDAFDEWANRTDAWKMWFNGSPFARLDVEGIDWVFVYDGEEKCVWIEAELDIEKIMEEHDDDDDA